MLGGLAGGRRRVPGQVRGTAGEGGGHAGQPAGAGRPAGGARGTRPAHTKRQIDQTDRRILQGEEIPQKEKVLSVFEEHTLWISKGKAGDPVELGVPVAIVEDHLLEHRILWEGSDTDAAVPVIEATRERFPELVACSFDRGFHSPQNQAALGDTLELNAMPAKGRLPASRREHEAQPDFVLARQQHPAVESAINNLEQRGLNRVRTHGKAGFARTVALSILAANVLRVGLLIRAQERARLKFLQRTAA